MTIPLATKGGGIKRGKNDTTANSCTNNLFGAISQQYCLLIFFPVIGNKAQLLKFFPLANQMISRRVVSSLSF